MKTISTILIRLMVCTLACTMLRSKIQSVACILFPILWSPSHMVRDLSVDTSFLTPCILALVATPRFTAPVCYNSSTSVLSVSVTGGTPPYLYVEGKKYILIYLLIDYGYILLFL